MGWFYLFQYKLLVSKHTFDITGCEGGSGEFEPTYVKCFIDSSKEIDKIKH